ncbi:MAG: hypothetical protein HBSIN02_15690 [Bacteroidia bacterium]|nr:MAG: hypothetical protein HBSIN02_15690 [Bacteroidia bacterium]
MILVIERDFAMRQALALYVESLGFTTQSAPDASAALVLCGHGPERFRVVIFDADQNPQIDSLVKSFLSLREGLRFIVTYGFGGETPEFPSSQLRMIRKPYEPQELHEALKSLMS